VPKKEDKFENVSKRKRKSGGRELQDGDEEDGEDEQYDGVEVEVEASQRAVSAG
jgi:hypothetical protein